MFIAGSSTYFTCLLTRSLRTFRRVRHVRMDLLTAVMVLLAFGLAAAKETAPRDRLPPDPGSGTGRAGLGALIKIYDHASLAAKLQVDIVNGHETAVFCPGQNFSTVYEQGVDVDPGDILLIHAQIETTNDLRDAHGAWQPAVHRVRLVAEGTDGAGAPADLGTVVEGSYPQGKHHLAIGIGGLYQATNEGQVRIRAQFQVDRLPKSDGVPCTGNSTVWLNKDYGGIHIEQFRNFPSVNSARDAGALALATVARSAQVVPGQSSFGRCVVGAPATPYRLTVSLDPGDIVTVVGQTGVRLQAQPPSAETCGPKGTFYLRGPVYSDGCRSDNDRRGRVSSTEIADELHGLVLRADRGRLHAFTASENVSVCLTHSTLTTHGVLRADRREEVVLSTSVNGVTGYGGRVIDGAGQLFALVFKPLDSIADKAPLLLKSAGTASAGPTTVLRRAVKDGPAKWGILIGKELDLPRNAELRASSLVQIPHPRDVRSSVCVSQLLLKNANNVIVDRSAYTEKDSIPDTNSLPLPNEALFTVPSDGRYSLELRGSCEPSQASSSGSAIRYVIFAPATE
jgi:hypothetical protein